MAESNYHFEARRKERLIERKHEALARLSKGGELGDCTCTSDLKGNTGTKNTQIMYSGPGDFDNNSWCTPSAHRLLRRPNICSFIPGPHVGNDDAIYLNDVMVDRSNMLQRKQEDSVALEEVVHDPNFKYRFVKACGGEMLHVDPIYRIMYPGALRRVNTKQGYIFLIAPQRQLENFRVSDEGFKNRFRYQNATFPHLDRVYPVLYPAKDNLDYTANDNWNNRRMNIEVDKTHDPVVNSAQPKKSQKDTLKKSDDNYVLQKKPPPDSVRKIPRDQVFQILHPYDFW